MKELTGSDRIRARRLYQDFFEFSPSRTAVLCTNHLPQVRGQDHGIWRRLVLLPFTVAFWNPDKGETGPEELRQEKHLPELLSAEAPGILAWMVRGCLEWQSHGLSMPVAVQSATDGYREEFDALASFISECCIVSNSVRIRAGQLHSEYLKWAERNGERPMSKNAFASAAQQKGYQKTSSNGTWYLGIALRHDAEDVEHNS